VIQAVQLLAIVLAGLGGAAVVLQRDPRRQVLVAGIQGLLLVMLFMSFAAPDVALSALVVSAFAVPLIALLALAKDREAGR
jgi:energy-converting hydrogenase B subunit D